MSFMFMFMHTLTLLSQSNALLPSRQVEVGDYTQTGKWESRWVVTKEKKIVLFKSELSRKGGARSENMACDGDVHRVMMYAAQICATCI